MKKNIKILPRLIKFISKLPENEQLALYRELIQRPIKRKHLRQVSALEIGFSVDGKEYSGTMRDKSFEGLFIETDQTFDIGQEVKLEIPSNSSTRIVRTTGIVVRIIKNGIGIKLTKYKKY